MIVVTGGAGFIGSNLVRGLNAAASTTSWSVDDLTDGRKFANLVDCEIADYLDKTEFYERFARGALGRLDAIFHQGACADTMEWNGRYMLDNNYRYSVELLETAGAASVPLLYASSAAVYGASTVFKRATARSSGRSTSTATPSCCSTNVVRRALPSATRAGRRLSLLQRLRAARAAQGPHGERRVPPLQRRSRARARSSCSANTAAMRRASSGAISSTSTTSSP